MLAAGSRCSNSRLNTPSRRRGWHGLSRAATPTCSSPAARISITTSRSPGRPTGGALLAWAVIGGGRRRLGRFWSARSSSISPTHGPSALVWRGLDQQRDQAIRQTGEPRQEDREGDREDVQELPAETVTAQRAIRRPQQAGGWFALPGPVQHRRTRPAAGRTAFNATVRQLLRGRGSIELASSGCAIGACPGVSSSCRPARPRGAAACRYP